MNRYPFFFIFLSRLAILINLHFPQLISRLFFTYFITSHASCSNQMTRDKQERVLEKVSGINLKKRRIRMRDIRESFSTTGFFFWFFSISFYLEPSLQPPEVFFLFPHPISHPLHPVSISCTACMQIEWGSLPFQVLLSVRETLTLFMNHSE